MLVKTSNPGSGELQDVKAGDGAPSTRSWATSTSRSLPAPRASTAITLAGAVTGATYPQQIQDLRSRLPHTFFLVPGYGAQGGTAADVQYAFDEKGRGAIVNSSRCIMCAWKKTGRDGQDYQEAARAAAEQMRDELREYITIL